MKLRNYTIAFVVFLFGCSEEATKLEVEKLANWEITNIEDEYRVRLDSVLNISPIINDENFDVKKAALPREGGLCFLLRKQVLTLGGDAASLAAGLLFAISAAARALSFAGRDEKFPGHEDHGHSHYDDNGDALAIHTVSSFRSIFSKYALNENENQL